MKLGKRLGCHQMPERSFSVKGYQFPICARCTGVLLGELVAIISLFFFQLDLLVSILLLIPMGIDWGLQYIKLFPSNNVRRVITGTLGGYALTFIYYHIICGIIRFIII